METFRTLSKFFSRSIILPSTSCCVSSAGAEYHLIAWSCGAATGRAALRKRQGVVVRETGNWIRRIAFEAHQADCLRAIRSMMKVK